MTPTYDLAEQAGYLRDDIRDIISQIQHTPSETDADRFRLLSLLFTKYAITAEARRIVCEVNHTLHSTNNDRLPYSQYLDIKNAHIIAREVIDLAHSTPPRMIPSPLNHTEENRRNSDYHFVITDVAVNYPSD